MLRGQLDHVDKVQGRKVHLVRQLQPGAFQRRSLLSAAGSSQGSGLAAPDGCDPVSLLSLNT